MTATVTSNPLLIGEGLPPFKAIQPECITPGINQLIEELAAELTRLEAALEPSWSGLVEPLTRIEERLRWSWGIVGHLMGVKNSPKLREAYQAVQSPLVHFANRMGQSKPIYQAFKKLQMGPEWETLNSAQRRIVESAIREAELSGVALEGAEKDRFNQIQQELAELSTQFSNNLLDATKDFVLTLTDKAEVEGLPASLLALAAQGAREAGDKSATAEAGPWRITLDFPSFRPFLQHSRRRDLRERVYRAYITRASQGELNNTPLIEQILTLRREMAGLLGYDAYAELSIARKMAPSVAAVEQLMEELRSTSYKAATQELQTLQAFANEHGAKDVGPLMHWDISFWTERMREKKYGRSALPTVFLQSYSLIWVSE